MMNRFITFLILTFSSISACELTSIEDTSIYSSDPTMTDESLFSCLQEHGSPGKITHIDIMEGTLSDQSLFTIADSCPNLLHLNLTGHLYTDEGCVYLAEKCPQLKWLEFWNCEKGALTNTSLIALAEHCRGLRVLSIDNQADISDEGLEPLVKNCHELRQLSCSYQSGQITDTTLFALADNCPHINKLDISGNPFFTVEGLERIVKKCKKMECLYVVQTSIGCKQAKQVWKLNKELEILYSSHNNVYYIDGKGREQPAF